MRLLSSLLVAVLFGFGDIAEACNTYEGDVHVTNPNAVYKWGTCIINGNLIFKHWDPDDPEKYKRFTKVTGSVSFEGCGRAGTDRLPILQGLTRIEGNKARGVRRMDYYCKRGWFAESFDSFSGLIINSNPNMKEITAGDGGGANNNKRFPMFPKLTYIKGINIVNMINLAYFDVNIFPFLDTFDGDLFVETPRYIKIGKFPRLYTFTGNIVMAQNAVVKVQKTCHQLGLLHADGVSTSSPSDKQNIMACKCPAGKWLTHYGAGSYGRVFHIPDSSMCYDCTNCKAGGMTRECSLLGDRMCTHGQNSIGTNAPTPVTISPTAVTGAGGLTGPLWNANFTGEPIMLFDASFKSFTGTGFRIWFRTERNIRRNGYITVQLPTTIMDVKTTNHPKCFLYQNWTQTEMGENIVNNYDAKITSGVLKMTIGDFGLKQEMDHLIHCWQYDVTNAVAFKFKNGNSPSLGGTHIMRQMRTYTAAGALLDKTDNLHVQLW